MLAMLIICLATLTAFWLYRQVSTWQTSNSKTRFQGVQRARLAKARTARPGTPKGGIRKPWGW